MKKVMVFGTFDGLHPGHISFFKQAKKYGDYLIVVVAKDKTVKETKNHLPYFNESERLRGVADCGLADEAKLGYTDDHFKIIKEIKPDIICLGYDQKSFTEELPGELEKMGLKIEIRRMKPHKPEKYHSSLINKKVIKKYARH